MLYSAQHKEISLRFFSSEKAYTEVAIFEFENALRLEKEGQEIIELGRKINGLDFDIITKSTAIECKNWNWKKVKIADLRGKLGDKLKKANYSGLNFELHSKTLMPQEIKIWLQKKNIKYYEYLG